MLRAMEVKKIEKVGTEIAKIAEIRRRLRSLGATTSYPRSLTGDRLRRAPVVIPHACDPNDIQGSSDMIHNAHCVRLWRS